MFLSARKKFVIRFKNIEYIQLDKCALLLAKGMDSVLGFYIDK